MADDEDLADPEEVDEVSVVMAMNVVMTICVFNGRMSNFFFYNRIVLYNRDCTWYLSYYTDCLNMFYRKRLLLKFQHFMSTHLVYMAMLHI